MAPGLNIIIATEVPFAQLVTKTADVLARILKTESIPQLEIELPPAERSLTLNGAVVGSEFPGAYVSLSGIPGSMVDIGVFGSKSRRLIGCSSSGRTAASDVLTAAVAIAAAYAVGGKIMDDGHYWLDRDEYDADELMKALEQRTTESPRSIDAAISIVSKKQFKPPSYGGTR